MKKEKKMTTPDKELMEKFVQEARENDLLRAHSKHSMRLGNIELEVIPTDKTQTLESVMSQFAAFAKLMKELHGDAHLISEDCNPNSTTGGMFE